MSSKSWVNDLWYVPLAQRKSLRPVLRGSSSTHLPTNDGIGPLHDTSWQNVSTETKSEILILNLFIFTLCVLESSVGFRLAIGSCDHYISKGIDSAYPQCLILEISVETKKRHCVCMRLWVFVWLLDFSISLAAELGKDKLHLCNEIARI